MSILDVLRIHKGVAQAIIKNKNLSWRLKGKLLNTSLKKIKAQDLKETARANKPLTMYRAENYPNQAPFLRPDTDPKQELVGRWFTSSKDFAQRFAKRGEHTMGIKKIKVKPPITAFPHRHKTINELMADRKNLKDWVPPVGMGEGGRDLMTTWKPNIGGTTRKTRLEYFLESPALRDKVTLTPPREITDAAKFDPWLSLLEILKNKNPRMLKEILTLIKAKRRGLKTGGIV